MSVHVRYAHDGLKKATGREPKDFDRRRFKAISTE